MRLRRRGYIGSIWYDTKLKPITWSTLVIVSYKFIKVDGPHRRRCLKNVERSSGANVWQCDPASNSIRPPVNNKSVHNHRSSPWSYINFSRGHFAWSRYCAITLFFIRLDTRIRLKHPGEHKTQPRTCSADFPNQWPTAYSNLWNITMGPFPAGWIWLQQAATSWFEQSLSRTNSKSIGLNLTSPSRASIKLFSFTIGSPLRLVMV